MKSFTWFPLAYFMLLVVSTVDCQRFYTYFFYHIQVVTETQWPDQHMDHGPPGTN